MTAQPFRTSSPAPRVDVPGVAEPDLSVIVVTYGTGTVVIDGLASLMSSMHDSDVGVELIAVDQPHPTRPTRTINHLLLDTSGVRVVCPDHNLGFGGGCNLGAHHARGRLLAFVNPDIEFAAGWLSPLVAALDTSAAAIAAPVLRNVDGSIQSAGHRLWADGSTSPLTGVDETPNTGRPDYASAACWVMERSVFRELGGFDESFFPAYYEDVDLALRARTAGGTVVTEQASVIHRHGASTDTSAIPDTTPQRLRLLAKWPSLAQEQPAPPRC